MGLDGAFPRVKQTCEALEKLDSDQAWIKNI